MRQSRHVGRIGREVEWETEAVEIGFQIPQIRIAVIESSTRGELSLEQKFEGWPLDPGHNDLTGLGVKVSAETLEVSAQRKHIPAQALVNQLDMGRHHGNDCRALTIDQRQ